MVRMNVLDFQLKASVAYDWLSLGLSLSLKPKPKPLELIQPLPLLA